MIPRRQTCRRILKADTDYRGPLDTRDNLIYLLILDQPVAAGCGRAGSKAEILTYPDPTGTYQRALRYSRFANTIRL